MTKSLRQKLFYTEIFSVTRDKRRVTNTIVVVFKSDTFKKTLPKFSYIIHSLCVNQTLIITYFIYANMVCFNTIYKKNIIEHRNPQSTNRFFLTYHCFPSIIKSNRIVFNVVKIGEGLISSHMPRTPLSKYQELEF